MDQTMRDKLSQLVEELTTSGEPQLNQDKMKEVKKICKYVFSRLLISSHTVSKNNNNVDQTASHANRLEHSGNDFIGTKTLFFKGIFICLVSVFAPLRSLH